MAFSTKQLMWAAMGVTAAIGTQTAMGQISYTTGGSTYSQNFDTLPSSAGGSPAYTNAGTVSNTVFAVPSQGDRSGMLTGTYTGLSGWYFTDDAGTGVENFNVDAGTSTTGSTFSYGAAASAERALGGLSSGAENPMFGVAFTNNTGGTLTSFSLAYTGEQWRQTANAHALAFSYFIQTGAFTTADVYTAGTAATGLNFTAPNTGTAGALDGNLGANQTAVSGTLTGLTWNNGETLWLRWRKTGTTSPGLAVDGLTFSASAVLDLTWNPGSTTWNEVGANTNWLTPAPAASAFTDGNAVHFTDAGLAGGSTVTVTTGVEPSLTSVENTTGTYTFQSGSIDGSGSLTKINAGTLVMTNSNSYTGGTNIDGGTVSVGSDSYLGNASGSLEFGGGTLLATGTLSGSRSITVNAGGGTINSNGNNVTQGGVSGSGNLAKTGAGNLTFTGAMSTYTGELSIATGGNVTLGQASGTIQLRAAAGGGTWVGDLDLTNGVRVDLNAGTVSGGGAIKFHGTGGFLTNNGITGTIVTIDNDINLNADSIGGAFVSAIACNGTTQELIITGVVSGASDVNWGSNVTGGGTGATVKLNTAATYTGNTTINFGATGKLQLGVADALPTGTGLTFGTLASVGPGTLEMNGFSQQVAFLSSGTTGTPATAKITNATASNVTLTVTGNTTPSTGAFAGFIEDGAGGGITSLTKGGTHTLTLSGTNTYTGATTVSGGKLVVNGSLAATAVSVATGARLGGTGTIGGAVTMGASSFLEPGASPGNLTVASMDISAATLTMNYEMNDTPGGGNNDKVTVTGALTLPAASSTTHTVNVSTNGGMTSGTYNLITYGSKTGSVTGNFSAPSIFEYSFTVTDSGSSVDLNVTFVPNEWNLTTGGNWGTASPNWAQSVVPNDNAKFARFLNVLTTSGNVDLQSTDRTVRAMQFNNSTAQYTVNSTGGGKVILDSVSGNAAIDVLSGTHFVSAPVQLTTATDANVATGLTFEMSGLISGSVGLNATGDGVLKLTNASNSFTNLTVTNGTVAITTGGAIGSTYVALTNDKNLRFDAGSINIAGELRMTTGGGGGNLNTNGNNGTISGKITGGATLDKDGSGILTLSNTAMALADRVGATNINGGTIKVTGVNAGFSQLGNGGATVNVFSGATLEINGVALGTALGTEAPTVIMNDLSTFTGSGGASSYGRSGGFNLQNGTVVTPISSTINTLASTDTLTFTNSLRQVISGGETYHTVHVDGPGRVVIESGPVSSPTAFAGEWELENGYLQLGPLATGGGGQPLNALGMKNGDTDDPNPIKLDGGVLVGAENIITPGPTVGSFKNPITFNGGAISSGGGPVEGIDANFSGNLSIGSGSIYVTDMTDFSTARNVNLTTAADDPGAGSPALPPDGNITWTGGTLVVKKATGGSAGAVNFSRNVSTPGVTGTATVTVTPGATLQIDADATVNLGGTLDHLVDSADSTKRVNVVNNSTASLNVTAGSKTAGTITGIGNTKVNPDTQLTALQVQQNNLNIDGSVSNPNAKVTIDNDGTTPNPNGVLNTLTSLTMANDGGASAYGGPFRTFYSELDLKDNNLAIRAPGGTGMTVWTNDILPAVLTGFNNGAFGNKGISSSTAPGAGNTALAAIINDDGFGNVLFSNGGDIGAGSGQTEFDSLGALTIDDILIKYTYYGDLDFSGQVDGLDQALLDIFFGSVAGGWLFGDIDYNGFTDGLDQALLDIFFGNGTGGAFGDPLDAGGSTAIPEPATLTLLALGGLGLLRRRRRR